MIKIPLRDFIPIAPGLHVEKSKKARDRETILLRTFQVQKPLKKPKETTATTRNEQVKMACDFARSRSRVVGTGVNGAASVELLHDPVTKHFYAIRTNKSRPTFFESYILNEPNSPPRLSFGGRHIDYLGSQFSKSGSGYFKDHTTFMVMLDQIEFALAIGEGETSLNLLRPDAPAYQFDDDGADEAGLTESDLARLRGEIPMQYERQRG